MLTISHLILISFMVPILGINWYYYQFSYVVHRGPGRKKLFWVDFSNLWLFFSNYQIWTPKIKPPTIKYCQTKMAKPAKSRGPTIHVGELVKIDGCIGAYITVIKHNRGFTVGCVFYRRWLMLNFQNNCFGFIWFHTLNNNTPCFTDYHSLSLLPIFLLVRNVETIYFMEVRILLFISRVVFYFICFLWKGILVCKFKTIRSAIMPIFIPLIRGVAC